MDKNSKLSDAVGDLYRAALYLAKDNYDSNQGINFAENAIEFLEEKNKYPETRNKIKKYLQDYSINDQREVLILAEKILDQYLLLS